MFKKLFIILIVLITTTLSSKNVYAIMNPLSVPNNKFGVHILFTTELSNASRLVNSNGGDWGYVTIPIQAGDKDIEKWQKFMDETKEKHIIPILRLASENYYFDTKVWRKSRYDDVLDFANFLNSLEWPVKNRYVVIFNEVNRSDEWEGNLNPKEYAEILKYAAETFKSLNSDFFIISSGLDNAAPNISGKYMDQYDYMIAMNEAVPGILGLIDGLGSHSYPNPGFRQPAHILTSQSIYSWNFEKNLAYRLSGKNLPVFITETGWSKKELSENQIAANFKYAYEYIWSDDSIVAVTPFLLSAGVDPFLQFSLMDANGNFNEISKTLQNIPKTKGQPAINYGTIISSDKTTKTIPLKTFTQKIQYVRPSAKKTDTITDFLKWLLRLSI